MSAPSLEDLEKGSSLGHDAWLRLRKNRLAVIGGLMLIFIALFCLLGPMFSPDGYEEDDILTGAAPPSATHWMGTDYNGRDLCTRVMVGGRVSFAVGLAATAVSLLIGVLYGATAGYLGGRTDMVLMRIVDILYALPFTIFVILLLTLFGRNFVLLFFAIGAVEWLTMARIVRAQVMGLKRQEFIEACVAIGMPRRRIILRHLVPNCLGPVVVYVTLTVPSVMLLEAFLSFLGLGVQPPMSSWGILIGDGAKAMEVAPWQLLFPGLFFSLTIFSLNALGDGLRDALDVRGAKD